MTYVATWAGVAYVCFIIDAYSRRIVGWASRRTWRLVAHSNAGSQGQFTSVRWGERLAELGAVPSVGSVGDSYDCDVMVGLPGRV